MQNSRVIFGIVLSVLAIVTPSSVLAQSSSLSVTPTIHEMFVTPGQKWQSSIKVTNHNPVPLTIYTEPVLFSPRGERGHSTFESIELQDAENVTLAEWMQVATSAQQIPPESSISVPITVSIPEDAAPGGHYAAILIGTRPPEGEGVQVATAQIISSLFFVRVEGDVIEEGRIRSFRSQAKVVQSAAAEFVVRFENTGNVHLRPQGEIVITNMWGRERGVIPINQRTNFGNVLPESIREFSFAWTGDRSLVDIGRYTATLTVGYGNEQKKFVTQRAHFWVVPITPLVVTLLALCISIWFISWCIRMYIRRVLALAGVHNSPEDVAVVHTTGWSFRRLRSPLDDGVIDLRNQLTGARTYNEWISRFAVFLVRRKQFFMSVLGIILVLCTVWWYFATVLVPARNYDVTLDTNGQRTEIDSEEVLYQKQSQPRDPTQKIVNTDYTIQIINTTDTPGEAVTAAQTLEAAGYQIAAVNADTETPRSRTVIVYESNLSTQALEISQLLNGALLSAANEESSPNSEESTDITIYIGAQ